MSAIERPPSNPIPLGLVAVWRKDDSAKSKFLFAKYKYFVEYRQPRQLGCCSDLGALMAHGMGTEPDRAPAGW